MDRLSKDYAMTSFSVCVSCGLPVVEGHRYCPAHQRQIEAFRQWQLSQNSGIGVRAVIALTDRVRPEMFDKSIATAKASFRDSRRALARTYPQPRDPAYMPMNTEHGLI
jgi:uncharacterized Zn finger protein (UPF0148 family)